jgi:L,D-transpeptidase-like protein
MKAMFSSCIVALGMISGAPLATHATTAVIVSVPDQKLAVLRNGEFVAEYPVSTSKFGLGDRLRSFRTPLGTLEVAAKIGQGAPAGAVFKSRQRTGEIIQPNTRGRDPIVTRILHLRGLERSNAHAFSRGIYIHGTAAENSIGRRASYGCIRMRSRDVVRVFDWIPVGTRVEIVNASLRAALHAGAAVTSQLFASR